MNRLRQVFAYLHYWYNSKSRYNVHSPFVYTFMEEILHSKEKYPAYQQLDALHHWMATRKDLIHGDQFGAGSQYSRKAYLPVSELYRRTAVSKKFCRLLLRISARMAPTVVLELGTGLGLSTTALALGNERATVYSIEASSDIATIAQQHFARFQLNNIQLIIGHFDECLSDWLAHQKHVDLVFIDGNHQHHSTLAYFHAVAPYCHNDSVVIFDDIRWSPGMYNAWNTIVRDPRVTLSIDIFRMGLIFFRRQNRVKEHYMLYF